ncbi:MAG TPA: DUF4136 domain-containing protein [Chitinophagaceae bacterium]|nr:DUF4136 domain-containing protein [Chitinophagaceae bacterium]
MQKIFSVLLAGVIALVSCTKDAVNNLEPAEKPLYITNVTSGTDFTSYATFSLADSVAVISNNQLIERVRTAYDAELISAIAAQMQARGYTRVAHGEDPDLGMSISRIYNDYTGLIDYGAYWGGYGGYWDPYYWGYGGYNYYFPPMIGTYTITEGAVTVDLLDLKNAPATNEIRLLWNGLIRGTGTFNAARVPQHAELLFAQSPYLAN